MSPAIGFLAKGPGRPTSSSVLCRGSVDLDKIDPLQMLGTGPSMTEESVAHLVIRLTVGVDLRP
ncbi:hypothetical protein SAMN03159406_00249 [Rhizobium sp. NFR03]|nr:hypothetical protein SAMN03159406_00249 [Rhizobium sp. NFR03]